MRFVSVRELRARGARIAEKLGQEPIVLTRGGKPFALLWSVTEDTLEEMLAALRRARAQAAVSRMRARALESGAAKMSPDEIQALIAEARRGRR